MAIPQKGCERSNITFSLIEGHLTVSVGLKGVEGYVPRDKAFSLLLQCHAS